MTSTPLPSTGAVTGLRETLDFFGDPSFTQQRFEQYGDVFETRLLAQRIVFIRGEKAIGDLLSQGDALEGWWPESVRQLLGNRSLANRSGPGHRARRRVVGQLFSSSALERYTPSINALIEEVSNDLLEATTATPLADRMRRFAFAVIAGTVLGLDETNRDALFEDFEIWTRALFSIPVALPGTPFAKAMAARQRLLKRLKTVLMEGDQSRGGLDLLSDGLDEEGIPLDDDDLAEQLLLLLFAGYETTASSLSCLFRALLINPEVAHWLQSDLAGGSPAPRLDATVLEVMRLTPPVGGFFRRSLRPVQLAGVEVPEHSVIQVVLTPSHPADATDLAAFRPQRHLDGSFDQTLLPFGGGQRVCLGKALAQLEIRLMAVGLLSRLKLELLPDCLLYTSPSPRDATLSRMPSSA